MSPKFVHPEDTTIKIRLEKNGRGGKSVTVLFDLPSNSVYFTELLRKMKSHCATGGTIKTGQMELQGDHRQKVKLFLEKLNFKVKLAGG